MQQTKKCYFLQIFKKGYILSGLFLGLLFATFLLFADRINLFDTIIKNPIELLSELVTIAFFSVIFLVYLLVKIPDKKYSVADSLYISLFFAGGIYIAYSLIFKGFYLLDVIASCVLVGLSLTLLVCASFCRDSSYKTVKICTRKGFFRYFYAIANKFSFPTIFIGSLTMVCAWYLILTRNLPLIQMIGNLIFFILCLVPTLVYLAASLGSKKISLLDGALLSAIIAMPVIIVQTLFTYGVLIYVQSSLILTCVFIAAVLLFTLMRAVNVNTKYEAEKQLEHIKNDGGNYFVRLAKKYNIFSMASIAGILTLLSVVLFNPVNYLNYWGGIFFFPYAIINLVCLAVLSIGMLMSIIHSGREDIGLGDFAFGVNAFTCIFSGISLAFSFNYITLGSVALQLTLNVAVLVARIMHASKPKIKKEQQAQ